MIELPDEAATCTFAACLASEAVAGDIIGLSGNLGVGKTVFARAFIRTLTRPDEVVPSPTFTLMQHYDSPRLAVYHYDLYRVESDNEVEELGFDDAMANAVSLIEWPERASVPQTEQRLDILIKEVYGACAEKRHLKINVGEGWSKRFQSILAVFEATAND
ncbi:MAG: tRNA (adenosine(37)-N6)-threonylcarbamoyltransferase complex ATPase subunit type 1 TsaE [Rhodospirillaceae bacterium]|nr:tRNA (adenosine(37)-N6)-threonylcarbamoyltransferase complex ATPase subunit type 1 TsaE [Rhodospirillaceae bacterium]|tara:strand:+ start:35 stop:517 length:483 start_codon:yes stop_codon:yes gene_type:complete